MADILTPRCPLCDQPPVMAFGGGSQAFCGNDDCRMLTWDPTLSRSGNLQAADFIDLSPTGEDHADG